MRLVDRKEVSCKVFTPIFDVLKRKNIDLNLALKNIPYSLDHVLNRHERIEWSVMCTFVSNIRPYLSISDFEEMGAVDIRDGFNQEYVASGLLMHSLNKFSKRDGENIVKSGEHNATCIIGEIVSTDKNCMKLKYYIDEEHEYFPEFVYVQRGGLLELGKLFGYKEYNVETIWIHNGAIFEVSWKNDRTFLGVKKWFFWIFNFRKAFLDLTESRAQLLNQYNKLDESKRLLQRQTTQLKTAHSLSTSIRQSLEMSDTLKAIIDILTKEAGFDEVIINIFNDFENNQINLSVKSENKTKNVYKIINDIIINEKRIGELIVKVQPSRDYLECKELFEYLLPVINIVIHDALVLRAIIDYRNNLEQKVITRTSELEKARDDLSSSNEQLKIAQKIQNNFFTNISHEFRTPLTFNTWPVKQLLDVANDENTKDQLKLIHRSAKKINRLVDELLDISKIESGEMKLKTRPLDIVSVVKEIVLSFHSLAERKRITFKFKASEEKIIAYIDKDKFDKIFSNVLSNAFKFTQESGSIDVLIFSQPELVSVSPIDIKNLNRVQLDNYVEITVRDTGIGIPKDQLDKIFNRFYQVDGSNTRGQEGTGIGLSLTKELMDLHKAIIEVESEEGKGSTFKLIFPLGKGHLTDEEICLELDTTTQTSVNEKQVQNTTEEYSLISNKEDLSKKVFTHKIDFDHLDENKLPTILIAEDNPDVRKYINTILIDHYNIIEAIDGEEGLDKSYEHIPDLIISDVMMPKMDGFVMCSKLKTDARTSHIPIIILTAKATIKDKVNGLGIGADDYIMKPFESEELKARIKNLLEQRKRLQEHFRKHGLFKIDEQKITSLDHNFIQKSIEVINNNLSNTNLSVEFLSGNLSVSKSVLNKKLSALTGETPAELIKRIRLCKAAKLIEHNTGNISEIALEVGFNNPAYFAECFRKQFGISPSQYHSNSNNS